MTIIERPTRRVLPTRQQTIGAVVLHSTGQTDLDKVLRYYTSPKGLQPHWLVSVAGIAYRIVDENTVAYHASFVDQEKELYAKGFAEWSHWRWLETQRKAIRESGPCPAYAEWRTVWPTLESPLDLAATGARPNSVSIGIELEEPTKKERTEDKYTEAQYEMLYGLLGLICHRHDIPRDRHHILGHQDISPMRRSDDKRGGWDPGPINWDRLFAGILTI
jgi:N-acetyl-anhydromuramyl-L-alanine amidase AmpD